MCSEFLQRIRVKDVPTEEIRSWSGLAHRVIELTGPSPTFGEEVNIALWLHEDSASDLLDMCDEIDARFAALKTENAKLRELAVSYDSALHRVCDQMQGYVDCHDCILGKYYGDDSCAIDELREAACGVKVELE